MKDEGGLKIRPTGRERNQVARLTNKNTGCLIKFEFKNRRFRFN
jgi:hypothetical protein